ncbi:MAG: hypothetical protein WAZ77_13330 [Candidatus Nitrosopolaris sp.]
MGDEIKALRWLEIKAKPDDNEKGTRSTPTAMPTEHSFLPCNGQKKLMTRKQWQRIGVWPNLTCIDQ